MASANPDPFFSLTLASGPMSTSQPVTHNLASGPSTVMQTIISQQPPPIVTSQAGPLVAHGGSGPSTHTAPPATLGGSGPSTYIAPTVIHGGNFPSTHTVFPTTLGGIGPSTIVPQVPPVMQVHHVPANPTTIAAPSHIKLGSNLPFMEHLNLPDLARVKTPNFHKFFFFFNVT